MRVRQVLSTAVVVSMVAALAGCGGDDKGSAAPRDEPTASASSDGPMDADAFWAGVEDLADRPAVDLDSVALPKAPAPFTKADVAAFATKARTVLERSYSPVVSTMGKEAAARFVLAEEVPDTTKDMIAGARRSVGKGNSWQVLVASRYDAKPADPTYLNVHWRAKTYPGKWSDGSKHRYL